MQKLILNPFPPSLKTEIYFGIKPEICLSLSRRGVLLADAQIVQTHGTFLQKILGYELIAVPSGEANKTREVKRALEDKLFQRKLGRDIVIVGVGGGVTTDLVGFLASTYMRGVPLILIPTTLLGMVDAAIGGKTGVNTRFGKNLIGSFYLPKAVFIESNFLKTLPEKEMKNGLGEILKYGLIKDPTIWEKCENWEKNLPSLIRASITCKIKVIEQDLEERMGIRRILNFGHTVGHALELISRFKISHGEAIALGCMAESYLSHLLGYLPESSLEKIIRLYQKLGFTFQKFDSKAFFRALILDKKAKERKPRFVSIDQIGHCLSFDGEYCTPVNQRNLEKMVEWMHDQR